MASIAAPKGQADLMDYIEWQSVECLNENPNHSYANAMKQGYREADEIFLESDGDEQLLLQISFNQVVKLHSLIIKAPADQGPKVVKLFANRPSMGFSNTSDFPPSDTITLTTEQLEGKPVTLKYVKFQNVRSLTIFVEENQEATDVTRVQKLALVGSTVETTNMSDLKKVEHNH